MSEGFTFSLDAAMMQAGSSKSQLLSFKRDLVALQLIESVEKVRAMLNMLVDLDKHVSAEYVKAYHEWNARRGWFCSGPVVPEIFALEFSALHRRLRELNVKQYPACEAFYANAHPHPQARPLLWEEFTALARKWCAPPPTASRLAGSAEPFNLCADWGKITADGESFGGYWDYPHDSDEYMNASRLTEAEHRAALAKLPYPHALVAWTIRIGCQTRLECVAFSRAVCEWADDMIRKTKCLKAEEMAQYERNCKCE